MLNHSISIVTSLLAGLQRTPLVNHFVPNDQDTYTLLPAYRVEADLLLHTGDTTCKLVGNVHRLIEAGRELKADIQIDYFVVACPSYEPAIYQPREEYNQYQVALPMVSEALKLDFPLTGMVQDPTW